MTLLRVTFLCTSKLLSGLDGIRSLLTYQSAYPCQIGASCSGVLRSSICFLLSAKHYMADSRRQLFYYAIAPKNHLPINFKKIPTGRSVAAEHLTVEDRGYDSSISALSGGAITKNVDASFVPYTRGRMRKPGSDPILNHLLLISVVRLALAPGDC